MPTPNKVPEKTDSKWSDPFRVGEIINIKGKEMRLIRIKQNRQELHFKCDEVRVPASALIAKSMMAQVETVDPNCFVCGKPTRSHRIYGKSMCNECYTTKPEIVAQLKAKMDAESRTREAAAAKEPEEGTPSEECKECGVAQNVHALDCSTLRRK